MFRLELFYILLYVCIDLFVYWLIYMIYYPVLQNIHLHNGSQQYGGRKPGLAQRKTTAIRRLLTEWALWICQHEPVNKFWTSLFAAFRMAKRNGGNSFKQVWKMYIMCKAGIEKSNKPKWNVEMCLAERKAIHEFKSSCCRPAYLSKELRGLPSSQYSGNPGHVSQIFFLQIVNQHSNMFWFFQLHVTLNVGNARFWSYHRHHALPWTTPFKSRVCFTGVQVTDSFTKTKTSIHKQDNFNFWCFIFELIRI